MRDATSPTEIVRRTDGEIVPCMCRRLTRSGGSRELVRSRQGQGRSVRCWTSVDERGCRPFHLESSSDLLTPSVLPTTIAHSTTTVIPTTTVLHLLGSGRSASNHPSSATTSTMTFTTLLTPTILPSRLNQILATPTSALPDEARLLIGLHRPIPLLSITEETPPRKNPRLPRSRHALEQRSRIARTLRHRRVLPSL